MNPTSYPFYKYSHNTFVSLSMIPNLEDPKDRELALAWLNKLKSCNTTVHDVLLRNDFLHYLVLSLQEKNLRPPFNKQPIKDKPLKAYIKHLDRGGENVNLSTEIKEKLNSNVAGGFLVGEQAPTVGAFCLMTVQSRIN